MKQPVRPVLLGNGIGATLAFVVLAEAGRSFSGAISMGFCPTLPLSAKLCAEDIVPSRPGTVSGQIELSASTGTSLHWIMQPADVRSCSSTSLPSLSQRASLLVPADGDALVCDQQKCPALDHLFSVDKQKPTIEASSLSSASIDLLPLIEIPAIGPPQKILLIVLSGDGGWASIDKELGDYFSERGVHVIGLNSLNYFWQKKTPEEAAADLARLLRHYTQKWQPVKVVLAGYSFGADVLPAIVNRLPEDQKSSLAGLVLLNPGLHTAFEIHLSDWLINSQHEDALPIMPEIAKLDVHPLICVYGKAEEESLCPMLSPAQATIKELPGAHHFDGDYRQLGNVVWQALSLH
jgi:type IV secretory pathway VirJ component